MTMAPIADIRGGRAGSWCATWSRENAESAVGTAASAARFVLVELPLPWPAEIAEHTLLQGCVGDPAARVQAIAGPQPCGYRHTIICYWKPDGEWFSGYERTELEVSRPDLPEVVGRLARGEGLVADAASRPTIDLLLCTHGTRDRCCAKLGGNLYAQLGERLSGRARLWRTSHTGGHRFAPTAITFPDGMTWAGLDVELAEGILDRTLPVERAALHLRGCAGVGDGLQQAADAAAFARNGWSWLNGERRAEVRYDDGHRAAVVVVSRSGGVEETLTANIERGRTIPVVPCGAPVESATKTTTELLIRASC
jgi:hypothetical protein